MEGINKFDGSEATGYGLSAPFNRVAITAEAVFDYEHCLFGGAHPTWKDCLAAACGDQRKAFEYAGQFEGTTAKLDQKTMKTEIEKYINFQNRSGRLFNEDCFRHKYLDEKSGRMLLLFFRKGSNCGIMQNWDVLGICFAEDWSEEAERAGESKTWLDQKIIDLDYDNDWVVKARVDRVVKDTKKRLYTSVLKEVRDEFLYRRDKAEVENVLLLYCHRFKRRRRRGYNDKDVDMRER